MCIHHSQRNTHSSISRLLHARILLLRPIFARFCLSHLPNEDAEPVNDTLEARVTEQCAMTCVCTAQKIVAALDSNQTSDNSIGVQPAWWYRIYYLYSAAAVLITAQLRPQAFPVAGLTESWECAVSLLRAHEKFGSSARRCVAALRILSSKMLEAASGERASPFRHESQLQQAGPTSRDTPPITGLPLDLHYLQQSSCVDDPTTDVGVFDLTDFDFDVNDLSWLNDMQATWGLINEQ